MQNPKIKESPRFKSEYLRELIELLNDEESLIRIEALEIMTEILEHFEKSYIDKDYMNAVLELMVTDIEDIEIRLAHIIGKIVHKLSIVTETHIIFKEKLLEYFNTMCCHKNNEIKRYASYNLVCFHMIYKNF